MVHDRSGREVWYRTVGKALFHYRRRRIIGGGVRVWKVKQLDPLGEPVGEEVVLKDYWLPGDSRLESEIQDDILARAAQALHTNNDKLKKHFMTILHDSVVRVGKDDDTSRLQLHQYLQPSVSESKYDIPEDTKGFPDSEYHAQSPKQLFAYRKHCRTVFKEVGTPVYDLYDLPQVFRCLHDALQGEFRTSTTYHPNMVIALKIFHAAGYVHGDISTGNLLLCKTDNGGMVCKISDLESAHLHEVDSPAGAQHMHKMVGSLLQFSYGTLLTPSIGHPGLYGRGSTGKSISIWESADV